MILQRYFPIMMLSLAYCAACKVANTLLFTIVSSLVLITGKTGIDFSNTVNEVVSQYVFLAYGLAACFVALTVWLGDRALYVHREFWNEEHRRFWQLERSVKEDLLRGASSGGAIALIYLIVYSLAGELSYLGVYLTSVVGTPAFPLFFTDFFSLLVFLFCEEFIFRHKIFNKLLTLLSRRQAIFFTAILYIGIKYLQFSLEPLDYLNLFLMNCVLGFYYLRTGRAHRGLSFMLVLCCSLHALAGLPLWHHTGPSFFLFKRFSVSTSILSGGSAGPLSSLGLTGLLLVFVVSAYLSWKKRES